MIKHCAPPPPELLDILTGRSAQKRQAREMLKKYNNAFAFVSYGEQCFHKIDGTRGPPVTVCHGTVYHLSGILFPDDGELGKYAQVYLYDHNEAMDLRQRNHWNDGLDKHILEQLQIMMDRESPYVAMYRSMKEKMSELPPETKMVIAETEGHDMRRYNKPRQLEPAVVFAAKTARRQQTETLQSGRGTHKQSLSYFRQM